MLSFKPKLNNIADIEFVVVGGGDVKSHFRVKQNLKYVRLS